MRPLNLLLNGLLAAGALLAIANLERTVLYTPEPRAARSLALDPFVRADRDWDSIRTALDSHHAPPVVGFWDDLPLEARRGNYVDPLLFFDQFALAPYILEPDRRGPWIVTDTVKPARWPTGYVAVVDLGEGRRLWRKSSP